MASNAAWRAVVSSAPTSRPTSTRLAASRLRSHSHGPGTVSSKSLMSITSCPRASPYRPKLAACASPQSWAVIPEVGVGARSAAIRPAEPRRKANGVAAIRPSRIGTSSVIRPALDASIAAMAVGRSSAVANSACRSRGMRSRRALPRSRARPSWCGANPSTANRRPRPAASARTPDSSTASVSCVMVPRPVLCRSRPRPARTRPVGGPGSRLPARPDNPSGGRDARGGAAVAGAGRGVSPREVLCGRRTPR